MRLASFAVVVLKKAKCVNKEPFDYLFDCYMYNAKLNLQKNYFEINELQPYESCSKT